MGDGGRAQVDMASFRVAGFSETLDWRPMLFQEPVIAQRVCVLCGVLYKKSVRLPCIHTLCTKCHARCVGEGSACPVDQQPFCEEDVERLEVSPKYILNRKVACWNAPRGCSFTGPAASLVEHYKECELSVVPCCLCSSSVLQSNILEHFKNGCGINQTACEPATDHTTQELSRACSEVKEVVGKISDDLMSLQTSLNRCSEDVRAEGEACKGQLEAGASRLSEQLDNLSTVCTTGFAEVLQLLQAAMSDYKDHVSKELRSQRDELIAVAGTVRKTWPRHCGPKIVHWHIGHWADLKKQVLEGEFKIKVLESPTRSVYGYTVSQCVHLKQMGKEVGFACFLHIHPGEHDSQLEWPFRKVFTVGVIHPKDQLNVISYRVNAGSHKEWFQRQKETSTGFGATCLSTASELEGDGFVENDTLNVFLEIEP